MKKIDRWFWLERQGDRIALTIHSCTPDGSKTFQHKVNEELVEVPEGTTSGLASWTLSDKECQDLLDALWYKGYRPSSPTGDYHAELKAINAHLQDMRTLVFKEQR